MAKYDELLKEYNLLAMRADKRLQRLEKLAEQDHYHGVLSFAYARAMRDIKSWSGAKGTRFKTKPPATVQQLQAKINDMKTFLDAPTSTKKGITNIYKQRAKTTNERYGTNFTWQDLANFYESDLADKLDNDYGSSTLIRAMGAIKRISNDPQKVQDVINGHMRLAQDDIINEVARNILANNIKITNLF